MLRCLTIAILVLSANVARGESQVVRFATWPEYGKNAGLVYAQEQGFFEAYGLATQIIDGYQNSLLLLESGDADVAQVLCSSAMAAILRGLPAKIVGARDQRNPIATVSLPALNIQSPADYRGFRWGHSAGFSPEQLMLDRLSREHHFSVEEIELVNLDYSARLPALLAGEVDFVSAWLGSGYPAQLAAATAAGIRLDLLKWGDFGVDSYGECFVARVNSDGYAPDWMDNWLAAAKEGFISSLTVPSEVHGLVLSTITELGDPDVFSLAFEQGNELLVQPGADAGTVLSMDVGRMSSTAEWAGLPVTDIDSMLFIPEAH